MREGTEEWGGSFRLTWVKPVAGKGRPCGAWQGLCRYHKTDTGKCTKRVNVGAPCSPDCIDKAKCLAKSWCLEYKRFDRKKADGTWKPRLFPHPPVEVMDLQVWVLEPPPPSGMLLSDSQRDALAALVLGDAGGAGAADEPADDPAGAVDAPADGAGGEAAVGAAGGDGPKSSSSSSSSTSSSRSSSSD